MRNGSGFALEQKSSTVYLDVAANSHGAEKGFLMHRALGRIEHDEPRVVEIGPGGGAAVAYLAAQLAGDRAPARTVHLTLIEAPGVVSESLTRAVDDFRQVGTCLLAERGDKNFSGFPAIPFSARYVLTVSGFVAWLYSEVSPRKRPVSWRALARASVSPGSWTLKTQPLPLVAT